MYPSSCESPNQKRTLFVTRFGLSDRTAIGVQTRYLLGQFPNHIHFYWNEGLFDPKFPGSRRIENWYFSRLPVLKKQNAAARLFTKLKLGRWDDDRPSAALVSFLIALRSQLSAVYLAPIDAKDAVRMRAIVTTLQMPFVLHLWDFLDNGLDHDATRWLVANAIHVFCLNRHILSALHDLQPSSSILTFTRPPPKSIATYKLKDELIVAIMGDIGSYRKGAECLIQAIKLLRRAGRDCRIVYIGRQRTLKQCGFNDYGFVKSTGFIALGDERDRILSECGIGFIPGPIAAPEIDARSKYSIPSRILDFMAVGMPFVGTVHPHSATYAFCRDLGIESGLLPTLDAKALARLIMRMATQREWGLNSRRNLEAFNEIVSTHQLGRLRAVLQQTDVIPKTCMQAHEPTASVSS